MIFVETCRQT